MISQPRQAILSEPPPPLAHRHPRRPQLRGHPRHARPRLRARQHDPRPLRPPRQPALRPADKLSTIIISQHQRRSSLRHTSQATYLTSKFQARHTSRRGLPGGNYGGSTRFYGGSTRWQGHLGRFAGLRLRCGDCRAAAGGCHCASLMMKRRAAAAAVRPCLRPDSGSPPSSFPQVTCLDRSGGPVLPPLFACGMRARPALAVLAWSGDGSPVWGCTTTSGDQVPRTHEFPISARFRACLNVTRAQASASARRSAFLALPSWSGLCSRVSLLSR